MTTKQQKEQLKTHGEGGRVSSLIDSEQVVQQVSGPVDDPMIAKIPAILLAKALDQQEDPPHSSVVASLVYI